MLRRRALLRWLTLGLIVACPLSLRGADMESQEPKTPVAHLEVQPARIDWMPQVDYERLTLTVAGPGDLYFHQGFGAGEPPYFSLFDAKGTRLPDGSYAYELRVEPRLDQATRAGGEIPKRALVQSGYLQIKGGSFVVEDPIQQSFSSVTKETVPEDLIVQGHACIGSTCEEAGDPVLHLQADFGELLQIRLEAVGSTHPSLNDWALQANEPANGDFTIRDLGGVDTIPFRIWASAPDNALTILYNGNIGLGTLTPGAALDVTRSTGALATLARFSNNLGIQVLYDRTDAGANDWQTSNFNSTFQISVPGSSTTQFSLNANGNLTIGGTLTELSSREAKTNFEALDPITVLTRLSELPISAWSYKQDTSARHIGPMAEDFHKAFGLGLDDKTIAPGDKAGVALVAIKGLNQIVAEKDTEIAALQQENVGLAERVGALEALVARLIEEKGPSSKSELLEWE